MERDNTFAVFASAVRASCEAHAQRKNYTNADVDGESMLTVIMQQIGDSPGNTASPKS